MKGRLSHRIEAVMRQLNMEAFIVTVRNRRMHERLECAIGGRGAFRYFKDVLLDYPNGQERWFRFKLERLHQRMLDD